MSKEYIIALLEGRDFIEIPSATKFQLQILWQSKTISDGALGRNWKSFAEKWNQSNSAAQKFALPLSLNWLIGTLGGDSKISFSKEYFIALLEGREFRKK